MMVAKNSKYEIEFQGIKIIFPLWDNCDNSCLLIFYIGMCICLFAYTYVFTISQRTPELIIFPIVMKLDHCKLARNASSTVWVGRINWTTSIPITFKLPSFAQPSRHLSIIIALIFLGGERRLNAITGQWSMFDYGESCMISTNSWPKPLIRKLIDLKKN